MTQEQIKLYEDTLNDLQKLIDENNLDLEFKKGSNPVFIKRKSDGFELAVIIDWNANEINNFIVGLKFGMQVLK
ncbi:hypothetical protein [Spiroplasma endosymbiont of Labia minor]|uniref:hypothetical protein n=1 Tax=Spiroplasma endosymbiont of Labia minor TaxID=3066305 RepID=UPI0030CF6CC8